MSNPNAIPPEHGKFKKGQSGNPAGRPKGIPNRKDILNYLLFQADLDEMGVIAQKPAWFEKVKPRTLYEVMTLAQAIKASSGDTLAYNALNKAMGDILDVTGDIQLRGATIEFTENPQTNDTSPDLPS